MHVWRLGLWARARLPTGLLTGRRSDSIKFHVLLCLFCTARRAPRRRIYEWPPPASAIAISTRAGCIASMRPLARLLTKRSQRLKAQASMTTAVQHASARIQQPRNHGAIGPPEHGVRGLRRRPTQCYHRSSTELALPVAWPRRRKQRTGSEATSTSRRAFCAGVAVLQMWGGLLVCLAACAQAVAHDTVDLGSAQARSPGPPIDPGWLPGGVILDFDPAGLIRTGLDAADDLAFLSLVAASDRVKLLGVTVTYGNAMLAHTKTNAMQLLRLAGVEDSIPRVSGVADWGARPSTTSFNPAAEFIVQVMNAHAVNTVTIVCLGPLTNLAAALQLDPSIAARARAVLFAEGVRGPAGGALNLGLSDPGAVLQVLSAPVSRIFVPRRACEEAPVSAALVQAARVLCPGAAACEYLEQLERAAQRGEGTRGWVRDVWDALVGSSGRSTAVPVVQEALREHMPAAARSEAPSDEEKQAAGSSNLRHGGGSPGLLCDLVAVAALLAPASFREWDVVRLDSDQWSGSQEAAVRLGFSAQQAQLLMATAGGRRRVPLPSNLVPDNADLASADFRGLPSDPDDDPLGGVSLLDPGVVLVPSKAQRIKLVAGKRSEPAPLVRALALAFDVPHALPDKQMEGAFVDDGLLNPYIALPVLSAALIGFACCSGAIAVAVALVKGWRPAGCVRRKSARHATKTE